MQLLFHCKITCLLQHVLYQEAVLREKCQTHFLTQKSPSLKMETTKDPILLVLFFPYLCKHLCYSIILLHDNRSFPGGIVERQLSQHNLSLRLGPINFSVTEHDYSAEFLELQQLLLGITIQTSSARHNRLIRTTNFVY